MIATLDFHGMDDVDMYKAIQEMEQTLELLTIYRNVKLPYITRHTRSIAHIATHCLNFLGQREEGETLYLYHQILRITRSNKRKGTGGLIRSTFMPILIAGEYTMAWIKSEEVWQSEVPSELVEEMRSND